MRRNDTITLGVLQSYTEKLLSYRIEPDSNTNTK